MLYESYYVSFIFLWCVKKMSQRTFFNAYLRIDTPARTCLRYRVFLFSANVSVHPIKEIYANTPRHNGCEINIKKAVNACQPEGLFYITGACMFRVKATAVIQYCLVFRTNWTIFHGLCTTTFPLAS